MRKNDIFGTARRFYFSFIRDRKHYKTREYGGGGEVYVTLPSQIYSSYLRDYKTNSVGNIKAFANAIKNLVVSLLSKISLIHIKRKS